MELIEFKITSKEKLNIEEWLKGFNLGKSTIYQLRTNDSVMVNNMPSNWNVPLADGDIVAIDLSKYEHNNYLHFKNKLDVLYEDQDVLVVNKPSDILVHPDGISNETLGNIVSFYYHQNGINRSIRHIHRLDFETSGALIYAKHFLAQAYLDNQIENRLVTRTYLAVVCGRVMSKEGVINSNIGRDRHNAGKFRVSKTGKEAITHYKVISSNKQYSLLEVKIDTGRTHQIRVHLSSINHPIVGDKLYGKDNQSSLMLHAASVEFVHPRTKRVIKVNATLPSEFIKLRRSI